MSTNEISKKLQQLAEWRKKVISENSEIAAIIQYCKDIEQHKLNEDQKEQIKQVQRFLDPNGWK